MKLVYVRLLQCSIRFDCLSVRLPNVRLCSIGKILGWVRLSSITEPNRRQSNDWSSIGFDYRTFDWPWRAQGTHALICKLQMEIKWEIKTYLWSVQFLNLLWSRVKLKLLYDAKTNQLRCLCQRFVHKFHNALFCVVCLAYHCWCHAVVIIVWRFTVGLLINGTVISAR